MAHQVADGFNILSGTLRGFSKHRCGKGMAQAVDGDLLVHFLLQDHRFQHILQASRIVRPVAVGTQNELAQKVVKTLKGSKVSEGAGSVENVLQKLDTGELELDGDIETIDNGDGTITVRMKVKPR